MLTFNFSKLQKWWYLLKLLPGTYVLKAYLLTMSGHFPFSPSSTLFSLFFISFLLLMFLLRIEMASHQGSGPTYLLSLNSVKPPLTPPCTPHSLNSFLAHQHCWNRSKTSFFGKIRAQPLPLLLQYILRGALPQRSAAEAEPRRSPSLEIAQIKAIIIKII